MPFFALEFCAMGISVVVHSEWSQEDHTKCTLRICASRPQMYEVASAITEGSEVFLALVQTLPQDTTEQVVCVTGLAATSLSGFIGEFAKDGVVIETLTDFPDLSGFWTPPSSKLKNNSGILVWCDSLHECHVSIVHSIEQAVLVSDLWVEWMDVERHESLLKKIRHWNLPKRSVTLRLDIGGEAAKLIHGSSLYAKLRQGIRAQSN